jgi:nicotinic acid mononucleotide adenylyltransferase
LRPNQLWFDTSSPEMRIWVDSHLQLAKARGNSAIRVGFFRDIPLFHLPPESAHPLGWSSFHWHDLIGKFTLEDEFWMALEASRLGLLEERPATILSPLRIEFELASEIVFYAGSFDPWHEGHESCLRLLPEDLRLIVCPDRNPHKPIKEIKNLMTHFITLSKKIRASTSRPLHIHPGFLLRLEANPTISWVFRMRQKRPDLRISLLMGYDAFRSLPQWSKASDLFKLLYKIYVVSRLEEEQEHQSDQEKILHYNPELKIDFLGRHDFEMISSSELRK